jgi:hypothetical protein
VGERVVGKAKRLEVGEAPELGLQLVQPVVAQVQEDEVDEIREHLDDGKFIVSFFVLFNY